MPDTNGKHQNKATTTEQENRSDDEQMHEAEKRELKQSTKNASQIPRATEKGPRKAPTSPPKTNDV
ncbi:MAG: hypothetical protein ACJ78I_10305 [Gemmatimonadaceae bacterium]